MRLDDHIVSKLKDNVPRREFVLLKVSGQCYEVNMPLSACVCYRASDIMRLIAAETE